MLGLRPEYAYLRAPLLAMVFLGVPAGQVIVVYGWRLAAGGWRLVAGGWWLAAGGWRLVTMVRRGTVFSHGAFRYVHIVIDGVATAVMGVALIVLVLRMLLAQAVARDVEATAMQAELEAVI
ncbi:DUF2975 domain-containing protein [Streptomyces sp. Marseille-Q5077]|uniref:DUF2975 domain-containing protein n=1 Tax=Streptomyces sp. Marseille-Q5077 TaxID=3418995 RepID=UPI003D070A50